MPTLDELRSEDVWRAQYVPQGLANLARNVRNAFGLSLQQVGTIGDERHLKGYHRSRAWILRSRYCTNRSYSVTETEGNKHGGDSNWVSGLDIVAGRALSNTIHSRLMYARSQGLLPYVRQILLEVDPWHVHISIDRAYANHAHNILLQAITGTLPGGKQMISFPVTLPVLREGSEGEDVETAQGLLCARGHQVKIDGDFGKHTRDATFAMQRKYGAESVDGVWGPETWTIAITGKDTR